MNNESFAKCVLMIATGNLQSAIDMLVTAGVPRDRAIQALSLVGATA